MVVVGGVSPQIVAGKRAFAPRGIKGMAKQIVLRDAVVQFPPENVQFHFLHLTNQWKNYTGGIEGWASGGNATVVLLPRTKLGSVFHHKLFRLLIRFLEFL